MLKYIIVKNSRLSEVMYNGPIWDYAGIREKYKEFYDSYEEAENIAKLLAEYNPVGFNVLENSK